MEYISLRDKIQSGVRDFVRDSKFKDKDTVVEDALFELVDKLKAYREEGKVFYPEIFLFHHENTSQLKSMLGGGDFITFSKTKDRQKAFGAGLKNCAPLCNGGWNIFFEISNDEISFGVFKSGTPIVSVPVADRLSVGKGDNSNVIISIKQIQENIVIIKSNNQLELTIDFSTSRGFAERDTTLDKFIKSICKNKTTENLNKLIQSALFAAIKEQHGFLIAICDNEKIQKLKEILDDGIYFEKYIELESISEGFDKEKNAEKYSNLTAYVSLISGFFLSDGITLMSTNGEVIGYRVFVKSVSGISIIGGARKRAFAALEEMHSKGEIVSILMQSQDGQIDFLGEEKHVK